MIDLLNCAACREKRCHTEKEWANHPARGHGFTPEQGWTSEQAKEDSEREHAEHIRKSLQG